MFFDALEVLTGFRDVASDGHSMSACRGYIVAGGWFVKADPGRPQAAARGPQ